MEVKEALIALNMIGHVGPIRLRNLLEHFGDPRAVLKAPKRQLLAVEGIGEETAQAIHTWQSSVDLGAELSRIRQYGCNVVTLEDRHYPELLKQIYDPPIVLYVKGHPEVLSMTSLAIVGARTTSAYGREVARRLAEGLTAAGLVVISGGARGIDTCAHRGALDAGGITAAVYGTGLNLVFPPENARLFEAIQERGAILTQFPFNRPADKQSFPIRNRIVAGMTAGTLVVEATLSSGALITANFAADYGRQVFAVPGRIDSPGSKGCHDLIKSGAKLCESVDDVVTELQGALTAPASGAARTETEPRPRPNLSGPEAVVWERLSEDPVNIDFLISTTGLSASAAAVALLSLEMKHLVTQAPGKMFARKAP